MRSLYVPLPSEAVERLRELASREFRDPKAQAAVLILDGLRRAAPTTVAAAGPGRRRSCPVSTRTSTAAPEVKP
jgi:hypothetical protein